MKQNVTEIEILETEKKTLFDEKKDLESNLSNISDEVSFQSAISVVIALLVFVSRHHGSVVWHDINLRRSPTEGWLKMAWNINKFIVDRIQISYWKLASWWTSCYYLCLAMMLLISDDCQDILMWCVTNWGIQIFDCEQNPTFGGWRGRCGGILTPLTPHPLCRKPSLFSKTGNGSFC